MRVALLHPVYWPEVERGSERILHDLGAGLHALGHRPRLITSHPGRPRLTLEDGMEVLRLPRPPEAPLLARGFPAHRSHLPASWAALHATRPDVAHAFYPTDAAATVRWGRATGRPTVLSLMGVPTRDALANQRTRLRTLERATRGSDAVVVLSEGARAATRRWLGVDAQVIRPGVDLDAFSPGGARAAEPTLACAADVTDPRKRIDLLVRAFAHVRRERPTARLLLIAPADPAVRARLDGPGVEWRPPGAGTVVDLFRTAWAAGLASAHEAFGVVLIEALACGTPAFGAAEGGVPEIIDRPEVGRLFAGDDPAVLARTLLETLELAQDPATAAACRSRAQAFSVQATAREHAALYARLLAR